MCWLWAKTQCNAHKANTAKLNLRKLIIQTGSAKANKVFLVKFFFLMLCKNSKESNSVDSAEGKLGYHNNSVLLCPFHRGHFEYDIQHRQWLCFHVRNDMTIEIL